MKKILFFFLTLCFVQAQAQTFVKDIAIGTPVSNITSMVNFNGVAFFIADDGVNGAELWKSDGTDAGTVMVKDINPTGSSSPYSFKVIDSILYFVADDGVHGAEVWKSDGTTAGTVLLKDTELGSNSGYPTAVVVFDSVIYFGSSAGLWTTDGTTAGTQLFLNGNNTHSLIPMGINLFFVNSDATSGAELWRTNGTAFGTTMVKDIKPGNLSSYVQGLTVYNNKLYFLADNGVNGGEFWTSDGSSSGTIMLKDIYTTPSSGSSNPSYITVAGSTLYFVANDGTNGAELWKTNGTIAGTVLVKDIFTGATESYISSTIAFNNQLFFAANSPSSGFELHQSNGTAAGTTVLKDINSGGSGSYATAPTVYNSDLYFFADNGTVGTALWKSDGTTAGTTLVYDFDLTSNSTAWGVFHLLTVIGNKLFISTEDGVHGTELWVYDAINSSLINISPDNRLFNLFPNPTNNNVFVELELSEQSDVSISISNLAGQTVLTKKLGVTDSRTIELETANLPTGVYLVQLAIGTKLLTKKLIITK